MKELTLELDIILQMQMHKAAMDTHRANEELVAVAIENLLRSEGYNNLAEGSSAA